MKKLYVAAFLFVTFSLNTTYASSNINNHNMPSMNTHAETIPNTSKSQEPTIKLDINKIKNKGDKKIVQIMLTNIKSNKPVKLNDLKEMHTQLVHLLIIDDSLEDYSHIHPRALSTPGLYEFKWKPKKQANYRIWADLFPLTKNSQEYVMADLMTSKGDTAKISHNIQMESTLDSYKFKLSFDKVLVTGNPIMGKIIVTDLKGYPVKNLEPIMGAFAHIVGFSDDFKTVVHIHPMGNEPRKSTDRGGPELEFHIEPEKAGFTKLFAQIKINGKELLVPFEVNVK